MALSVNVLREFVKEATKDTSVKSGETLKGTITKSGDTLYVKLDGSDQLTPYASSTAGVKAGDRVVVQVKDHSLTVLGNTSDVAFTASEGAAVKESILEVNQLVADSVKTENLEAAQGYIKQLTSDQATIDKLKAGEVTIDELTAEDVAAGTITAEEAKVINFYASSGSFDSLIADNITVKDITGGTAKFDNVTTIFTKSGQIEAGYGEIKKLLSDEATIEKLKSGEITVDDLIAQELEAGNIDAETAEIVKLTVNSGSFSDLIADNITAGTLDAKVANIVKLNAGTLTSEALNTDYANVDFSNMGELAVDNFYAKSGFVKNITSENGTYTGELDAVTINGDLIQGNTLKADRLLLLGEDGLYYRLNATGELTEAEQDDTNSLDGRVLLAKSITASKISVSDLAAFQATIAGLNLTDGTLYSGVKTTVDNTTAGFYLDDDGQLSIGDETNFIKFHKVTTDDGAEEWKLDMSSDSLAMLIHDANGNSMMTRADDGTWSFNFGSVTNITDDLSSDITDLNNQVTNIINNMGVDGMSYIRMGTVDEDGETVPSLLLGKADSALQLSITNQSINFMQGDERVAYITGNMFHIANGVLTNELHLGEQTSTTGSWVWKKRANEHLGLRYMGPLG